jgi:hypothetical protein
MRRLSFKRFSFNPNKEKKGKFHKYTEEEKEKERRLSLQLPLETPRKAKENKQEEEGQSPLLEETRIMYWRSQELDGCFGLFEPGEWRGGCSTLTAFRREQDARTVSAAACVGDADTEVPVLPQQGRRLGH